VSTRGCFVTGTDTGAGKSVLAAALCAAMVAAGERVAAFKPVVTGVDEGPADRGPAPDGEALAGGPRAGTVRGPASERGPLGVGGPTGSGWPDDHVLLAGVTGATPDAVCARTFVPAVSPHLAAELAGTTISLPALVSAARRAAAAVDVLVVEGVGGLLVPLSDEHDIRDLAVALGLPVVIAARPGLGTINHSLLTIEAARAVGLDVRAVVLTPWPAEPTVMQRSNRDTIARRGAVAVAVLPEVTPSAEALAAAGARLPWADWLGGVSI
jgi:dethiobiotin synthetase